MLRRVLYILGLELYLRYNATPHPRRGDFTTTDVTIVQGIHVTDILSIPRVRGFFVCNLTLGIVTLDKQFLKDFASDKPTGRDHAPKI